MPMYGGYVAPTPQQQADWNEGNTSDPDYIKNKPNIPQPDNGIWVGGVWKAGAVPAAVSGTVAANGLLTLTLTQPIAGNPAIFGTEIYGESLMLRMVEGDLPCSATDITIAPDRKTITCIVKKAAAGISVLGINVLGAAVLASGTVVRGLVFGK